jgi:hypothetical protein
MPGDVIRKHGKNRIYVTSREGPISTPEQILVGMRHFPLLIVFRLIVSRVCRADATPGMPVRFWPSPGYEQARHAEVLILRAERLSQWVLLSGSSFLGAGAVALAVAPEMASVRPQGGPMGSFTGRTAIVTGAAQGIGTAALAAELGGLGVRDTVT